MYDEERITVMMPIRVVVSKKTGKISQLALPSTAEVQQALDTQREQPEGWPMKGIISHD